MLFDWVGDNIFICLNGALAPVIYFGQSPSASGVKYDTFGVIVSNFAGRHVELIFYSSSLYAALNSSPFCNRLRAGEIFISVLRLM